MDDQQSQDSPAADADCSTSRVSKEEMRRHYLQCVKETESLKDTKDAWTGFICGFRTYERMATHLGLNLSDEDSKRFVPVQKEGATT